MNLTSPRGRRRALASLAVAVGLSLPLHAAHAAWSVDPVQVRATTSLCPAVAAIDDGHAGAYIAWQENGLSGGVILAQHLLASGDLDPAWTAPTLVCDRVADRSVLGAVSAGAGGAYFWWMEGAYLTSSALPGSAPSPPAGPAAAARFGSSRPQRSGRPWSRMGSRVSTSAACGRSFPGRRAATSRSALVT